MANLSQIRKQIKSVENVKQITKAMEMIAGIRLQRAQEKAEQSRPYTELIRKLLDYLALSVNDVKHPFFEKRKVKKTGLVVIAADKGLCGPYNTGVFQAADKFLKNYSPDQVELIVIGRKAVEYFKSKKRKIRHQMVDWGEKITFAQIKRLGDDLVHWFTNREYDEIWIVYTRFVSTASRKVMTEKFLNIAKPPSVHKAPTIDFILEPNAEEIYAAVLNRYFTTKLQAVLNESYASELAARVFSMSAATKNAGELIDKLTLVRNKVRQAGITKEMLEITAGAEGFNK